MWWRLLGGAAVLGLIGFLVWIYGNSRFDAGEFAERDRWKDATIASQKQVLDVERKWGDRVAAGSFAYENRIETVKPILVKNTETVERYANTPAGAVMCLPPERVFDIEATRAALFANPTLATGEGSGTVLAEEPDETARRQHDESQ